MSSIKKRPKTVGIIDIGSNSVRFVGYYIASEFPTTICNEKDICSLGEKLEETNKLSAASQKRALKSLKRLLAIAEKLEITTIKAYATAAIRDASNGDDFIKKIYNCLLYTSPSPRDQRGPRMPSSA